MKLSKEQIIAADIWLDKFESGSATLWGLCDIINLTGCNIPDTFSDMGQFVPPPDDSEFNPDLLDGDIKESRLEELQDGAKPNAKELELWRESHIEVALMGDSEWFAYYVWEVPFSKGSLYFYSLHGDGGVIDDFVGPFERPTEP